MTLPGGFDVLLMLTLASTAYFALRRSRYLATAATATATLLVVDAWFDVLTTPGVQRIESIALAVFVELPLASVCIWLSWHAQQLEERRIVLLMRRHRGRLYRGRPPRARLARLTASGRFWRHPQQQAARLDHHRELAGRAHNLAVQLPGLILVQRHLQLGELNTVDPAVSGRRSRIPAVTASHPVGRRRSAQRRPACRRLATHPAAAGARRAASPRCRRSAHWPAAGGSRRHGRLPA